MVAEGRYLYHLIRFIYKMHNITNTYMVDSDSENDEDLENNLNSNKDYPLVKDIQTVDHL